MYLIRGGPSLMVSALVSETGGPDSSVTALYGVTFLKKRFSVKTRNAVVNYICDCHEMPLQREIVTECPHKLQTGQWQLAISELPCASFSERVAGGTHF